jgi:5-methylcytosine-specific restriction endonuclease McrA
MAAVAAACRPVNPTATSRWQPFAMAAWHKSAKWKRRRVALLLLRDGPDCWLCARPLSPEPKKPGKRTSLEHLRPRCAGGADTLDNLVLCHDSCNRHLGTRDPDKKLRIRAKWHAHRQRGGGRRAAPGRPDSG